MTGNQLLNVLFGATLLLTSNLLPIGPTSNLNRVVFPISIPPLHHQAGAFRERTIGLLHQQGVIHHDILLREATDTLQISAIVILLAGDLQRGTILLVDTNILRTIEIDALTIGIILQTTIESSLLRTIVDVLEAPPRTITSLLEVPLGRTIISLLVDMVPTSLLRGFSFTMSEFKGYFELFFDLFWVLTHSCVIIFIIYCTFAGGTMNVSSIGPSGTTKPRRTTKFRNQLLTTKCNNHCLNRCLIPLILFINRASLSADRLLIYVRSYRFSQLNSNNTPMSTKDKGR